MSKVARHSIRLALSRELFSWTPWRLGAESRCWPRDRILRSSDTRAEPPKSNHDLFRCLVDGRHGMTPPAWPPSLERTSSRNGMKRHFIHSTLIDIETSGLPSVYMPHLDVVHTTMYPLEESSEFSDFEAYFSFVGMWKSLDPVMCGLEKRSGLLKVQSKYSKWSAAALVLATSCVLLATSFTLHTGRGSLVSMARLRGRKIQHVIHKINKKGKASVGSTFTILLRGNRVDLVQRSIDQHVKCDAVTGIQIDWDDSEEIPGQIIDHESRKVSEYGDGPVTTGAVLLLDEGILFSCSEIERAFKEWKLEPTQMLGLLPYPSKLSSLVSDKAAFVHNLLLPLRPKESTEKCSQVALSAMLSRHSRKSHTTIITRPTFLVYVETHGIDECRGTTKRQGFLSERKTLGH